MGKREHDVSYDVTEEASEDITNNCCGFKKVIVIALIFSLFIYTLGGVITGIAYYHYQKGGKTQINNYML